MLNLPACWIAIADLRPARRRLGSACLVDLVSVFAQAQTAVGATPRPHVQLAERPTKLMSPAQNRNRAANKQNRWSQRVTEQSNALDLAPGVFTLDDPRRIALSLKASAERSERRKTTPFRSAMSMLNFYVNRAGSQLPAEQRERLEAAKEELRVLFGRPRRVPPRTVNRLK